VEGCWGLLVSSREGCPTSLYVELSLETTSGVVVGFTNATVGSLGAGKTATLLLETYEPRAVHANLTKIDCY
jgi:hypothetical protein